MSKLFPGKGRRFAPTGKKLNTPRPQPTPLSILSFRLAQLDLIVNKLTTLRLEFQRPIKLIFNENGLLKFGAKENGQVIYYEECLTKLVLECDGIESDGQEEIRIKRKGIVKEIEEEIAQLDQIKKKMFEREQQGSPQTEVIVTPVVESTTKRPSNPSSPLVQPVDTTVLEDIPINTLDAIPSDQDRTAKRTKEESIPLTPPGFPCRPPGLPIPTLSSSDNNHAPIIININNYA